MLEREVELRLKGRLQIETARNALAHCNSEPSLVSSLNAFLVATSYSPMGDVEPNQAVLVATYDCSGKRGRDQREAMIDALLFQRADVAAEDVERLAAGYLLEVFGVELPD